MKIFYHCRHRIEGSAWPHRKGCTLHCDSGHCQHTLCHQMHLQEVDIHCCCLRKKHFYNLQSIQMVPDVRANSLPVTSAVLDLTSRWCSPVQVDRPLQVALMGS